ncbi:SulP family inorganic anion transporter [Acetobacter conturbans]|uniref:STAS domain-containing protein n=1 Tax=Acetobacter conturbans TaxID=1737472 RepID=A0ABX0K7H6_9PROT|nr:SulP family inorganic anion transporter [Acetobacter conturbans]NHN89349.1 STAS domain-containing protein [Acetobacter conturbans]
MASAKGRTTGWRDYIAGLSEAALSVPQVMGYARIAGVPAVMGLYTALLPPLVFAALGSSRHLVVAADSATAAILSGGLKSFAPPGSAAYIALVPVVALFTAGLLLIARLFRLGFLADFLSRTVLVGFLTGVGCQVAISMLHDMVGIPQRSENSLLQLWRDVSHFHDASLPTIALSLLVAGCIVATRHLTPRIPGALLAVVGSIAASAWFGFSHMGIATLGPVSGGLPHLGIPRFGFDEVAVVVPTALSCMFVIIAQSAATSRAFAVQYGEAVDENADILGLAGANMAAALSGAFVVNGSPTQTTLAVQFGARSQRAQVVVALVTGLILFCATGPLQYLPQCVLASIVFVIGVDMINVSGLLAIRRESPGEFRLALITTATVVAVGVEQGIFLAIVLSLLRHVRHSYEPHTSVLQPVRSGLFEATRCHSGEETEPGLIIYRFAADLFYANCTRFADDVMELVRTAPHPVSCMVIDAGAITDIDYSAAAMMRDLVTRLRDRKVELFFGRVSSDLRNDMARHRLIDLIGEDHLLDALHLAMDMARQRLVQLTALTGSGTHRE